VPEPARDLDTDPELPVIAPELILSPEEIEIVMRDAEELQRNPIVVHFGSVYQPGRVLEDNYNFGQGM
jgi:hypothetical protein